MSASKLSLSKRRLAIWVLLLIAILLCYFAGLNGGFVFDDEVNILENQSLKIQQIGWLELKAAALSGQAGPLGRPIALISFALNIYAAGESPFYFKLVNLLIHLGNTLLVGALAATLCAQFTRENGDDESISSHAAWSGLLVAALWGLHPLNLTSVLYVVQRMTTLSTFFGLIALLIYSRWRSAKPSSKLMIPWRIAFGCLIVSMLLAASAMSKESGLLFVPLLVLIEYSAFRFCLAGNPLYIGPLRVKTLTSIGVVLFSAAVVVFVLPRMLGAGAYANRDFTLIERALTESRVIWYYLRLLALPRSSELSLYHDDFQISTGVFEPTTTVLSLCALAAVTIATIALRRRLPVLLFAWCWFLISHSMESSVFPLELVHEHRNYFATIGIFVAVVCVLAQLSGKWRRLAYIFVGCYLMLLAGVTATRSLQWSNSVDFALIEASNHPHSSRANYELGRTYLILLRITGEQRFGPLAEQALRNSSAGYLPGLGPLFGLIQQAYYRNTAPDPHLAEDLKERLKNGPFYNSTTNFLNAFLLCQIDRHCDMPDADAVPIFMAALANPRIPADKKAEIYKYVAQYNINRIGDLARGVELMEKALMTYDSAGTRIMYAQALGLQGRFLEAQAQLDRADVLDGSAIYRRRIARERDSIGKAAAP